MQLSQYKIIRHLFFVFISISLSSSGQTVKGETPQFKTQATINTLDSVIIDLANASLTATYIDIPIYILSDDAIYSLDYAFKFNLSKLTFSATIDLLPNDPTLSSLSYFNPNDLYLRYTSSTLQNLPNNGIFVTKARFGLSGPCIRLTAADITDVLVILNGTQCSSRVTDLNFQKFLPLVNYIFGPTCVDRMVQYSDSSAVGQGSIAIWHWHFSNGDSSGFMNPLTTYTALGQVSATLIVTASTGCSDTIMKTQNINPLPIPSFSYSYSCLKDSVFFNNTSTITSGTVAGSLWDFGDVNGTSALTNPVYNYATAGEFTVTLIAISGLSCSATTTLQVSLSNKVSANFSLSPGSNCKGAGINFNDASTYSLNILNAWIWNFGDGDTSSVHNPIHQYTQAGTYSVTLSSISIDGCKGIVTKTLTIENPPTVQFSTNSSTTCASDTVKFTNQSISLPNSTFLWSFGTIGTSTLQNPVVTFTSSSIFPIRLIVTTPGGCSDTLSSNYTVSFPASGVAMFSQSVTANAQVSFTNLTSNASTMIWNFGDNQISTQHNPIHNYQEVGTYTACLTSFDESNCPSYLCSELYVGLTRQVAVPSCFTPNFDNVNDVLRVRGGPVVNMNFQVFNQWGNLLFSSTDQELGWDGTFNGEAQPVGVYKFILTGKTLDKKSVNMFGVVNITK